jgi:hypothetical protein
MVVVPAGVATASTGIEESPWRQRYFEYFLISKEKPIKPAVTVGMREKWKSYPSTLGLTACRWESFLKPVLAAPERLVNSASLQCHCPASTQIPQ